MAHRVTVPKPNKYLTRQRKMERLREIGADWNSIQMSPPTHQITYKELLRAMDEERRLERLGKWDWY